MAYSEYASFEDVNYWRVLEMVKNSIIKNGSNDNEPKKDKIISNNDIPAINNIDDARAYIKGLKEADFLTFVKEEPKNYTVCIIQFVSGTFYVNELYKNVLKNVDLVLNDEECTNYLYQNKEYINNSMLISRNKK